MVKNRLPSGSRHFYLPSDTALLKALYLAKFEATKKANDNDSEPWTVLWETEPHV